MVGTLRNVKSMNNLRLFTILPILRITAHALNVNQNATNGFGMSISLVASHTAAQSTDARIIIKHVKKVCRGHESRVTR